MPAAPNQVLTVSELTRRIKSLLEGQFPAVWIEGEISNFATAPSGHCYFTLKDANAQLSAVMFRGVAGKLTFKVADGQQVVARGDISVYERRGNYQIIVTQLQPKGLGALQLAFEQLKQKLAAEGLFDPARKKPLPALPARIGVVTSPSGAAIRDFLKILGRRYPNRQVIINPVRVQGDGAAAEIAAAIDQFNALDLVDVIVVTRGGGSLEDLWAFNEEVVACAIARSQIPTISAVGHEIDFTIADFVADLRAPTPSAAAELVVRAKDELLTEIRQRQQRLDKDLRYRLSEARRRLADCVLRQPGELVRQYQQRVDDLAHRLTNATGHILATQRSRLTTATGSLKLLTPQAFIRQLRQRLDANDRRLTMELARHRQAIRHRLGALAGKVELLSPKSTLARGYSITRLADGRVVKSVTAVSAGTAVTTAVADGEFESVVSKKSPK
ncbi:MAG: Exodeoxyribonuclease 7 large subunit [Verrucomicrobiae bacterium]|nr:Exodeoxyribonuclease 7 large subunit [Verrucomicrobiae bacterium]